MDNEAYTLRLYLGLDQSFVSLIRRIERPSKHYNMPRTPKKPSRESSPPQKPYPSTPDKTESKPSMRGNINGGKGTAWTGEELLNLFQFVLDRNGRDWGLAVEGRTANQARQTWS